jgi:hypothetical protein
MSAFPGSTPSVQSPDGIIRDELTAVHIKRIGLGSPKKPGFLHYFILASCIIVNIIFLVTVTDYPEIFIAASFYLNMFYFIILLIPTQVTRAGFSRNEITRFHAWLTEVGIKSGTSRFTRLFVNVFFMNSKALSLGIGLIFSIDILFALLAYVFRDLPLIPAIIVIAQSGIIIFFYLIVWKIEPFSAEFKKNIAQVRKRLSRENIPQWMVSAIFMTGVLFAAFIFLTAIILLPGMTVTAFMSQSGLNNLAYLIMFILILGVSQYFLVRHIHGITSREMAVRILDFQEDSLNELSRIQDGGRVGTVHERKDWIRRIALLIEARIYSVKKHTLLGTFPVYTADVDVSALMDTMTLTAINRSFERNNGIPEDDYSGDE